MILTFKPQFVEAIKAGTKIHTIRTDKKARWKKGNTVHFWNGNPRNVKSKPHEFAKGICTKVLSITIDVHYENVFITSVNLDECKTLYQSKDLDAFAKNDGFESWELMRDWFYNCNNGKRFFNGRLIYFELHGTR